MNCLLFRYFPLAHHFEVGKYSLWLARAGTQKKHQKGPFCEIFWNCETKESSAKNRDTPLCMKFIDTRNFTKYQKGPFFSTVIQKVFDFFVINPSLWLTKSLPPDRWAVPTWAVLSMFLCAWLSGDHRHLTEGKYENELKLSVNSHSSHMRLCNSKVCFSTRHDWCEFYILGTSFSRNCRL